MGVLLLGNFAFYILREIICIFVHNKLNFKHFLELSTDYLQRRDVEKYQVSEQSANLMSGPIS